MENEIKPPEHIREFLPGYPEWQLKIFKKYPSLFENVGKSPMESCMSFGLECGEGWAIILDNLFNCLSHLPRRYVKLKEPDDNKTHGEYGPVKVVLDQVKEKWGTLRVYYHIEDHEPNPERFDETSRKEYIDWKSDYIDGAIGLAEVFSENTSEISGLPGKLRTDGWWRVRTDEEYEQE